MQNISAIVYRRTIMALCVAMLAFAVGQLPVQAHAALDRTEPAANQELPASPVEVRAFFTEPVEPAFSELRVLDQTSSQVDLRDVRPSEDRLQLVVSLPAELPNGIYRVAWKALSSVDGHVLRGTFLFSVGVPIPTGNDSAQGAALDLPQPTVFGVGVRIATYVLYALLTGLLLLRFVLFRSATWTGHGLKRLGNLTLLVIVAMAIVSVLAVLEQASRSSGLSVLETLEGAAFTTLLQTRSGLTIIARLALLAALFFLVDEVLFTSRSIDAVRRRDRWIGTGLVAAEVAGLGLMIALISHSAATGNPLQTVLDFIHLTSMAAWFGGLFALMFIVPLLDRGWPAHDVYAVAIRRFSNIGLAAVVLLVATGIYQSAALAGGPDALLMTQYGLTLLIKLGLFAVLIGFGALNLWVLRPRLEKGEDKAAGRRGLQRSIALESMVALLVLGAVSVLTSQQPSRSFLISGVGPQATVQIEESQGLRVAFATDPAQLVNSRYQITLAEGFQPVTDAENVTLRFRNLLTPVGQTEARAQHLGYGIYVASGTLTALDGFWEADVIVRRPDRVDAGVQFRYAAGRSLQFADEGGWRLPPLDGLTFAGIGLLLVGILGLRWRARLRRASQLARNAVFGAAIVAFLAGGVALTSHAHTLPNATAALVNPVAASQQSLAAGRALYDANCIACHGVSARGNGPLARTLNPPPLDLVVHGPLHSDGELYGWITEGIPGTAMSSFADRLSETERWHIINYLRVLTTVVDR